MSRRPRVEFEGAIYHVTARVVGERAGRGVEGRDPRERMLGRYAGLTQREVAGVLEFASSSTVGKQQQRLSGELAKSRKLRRWRRATRAAT